MYGSYAWDDTEKQTKKDDLEDVLFLHCQYT